MFIVVIEFDRVHDRETLRERRFWTFADLHEATAAAEPFLKLTHVGSTHFHHNGDRIQFRECGVYQADTASRDVAKQLIAAGGAAVLHHALSPAIKDPRYWEDVLDKLDQGEKLEF